MEGPDIFLIFLKKRLQVYKLDTTFAVASKEVNSWSGSSAG